MVRGGKWYKLHEKSRKCPGSKENTKKISIKKLATSKRKITYLKSNGINLFDLLKNHISVYEKNKLKTYGGSHESQ